MVTFLILYSVALYGLLLFYGLTKAELVGRRPLAKFLCIKLIVMFTFYQSFVVRAIIFRLSVFGSREYPIVFCPGGESDQALVILLIPLKHISQEVIRVRVLERD